MLLLLLLLWVILSVRWFIMVDRLVGRFLGMRKEKKERKQRYEGFFCAMESVVGLPNALVAVFGGHRPRCASWQGRRGKFA